MFFPHLFWSNFFSEVESPSLPPIGGHWSIVGIQNHRRIYVIICHISGFLKSSFSQVGLPNSSQSDVHFWGDKLCVFNRGQKKWIGLRVLCEAWIGLSLDQRAAVPRCAPAWKLDWGNLPRRPERERDW